MAFTLSIGQLICLETLILGKHGIDYTVMCGPHEFSIHTLCWTIDTPGNADFRCKCNIDYTLLCLFHTDSTLNLYNYFASIIVQIFSSNNSLFVVSYVTNNTLNKN